MTVQKYKIVSCDNDAQAAFDYKIVQLETRVNLFLEENDSFRVMGAPFKLDDCFVQVCVVSYKL
ncbi:hypothetical protein LCGC14_2510340 [marine sediment metagenome]|uniref:Uncharacterized protein n=1 Tax=marine sediment metagenome TaxID=412755 RepID=A0A0F9BM72_9ZZZZ